LNTQDQNRSATHGKHEIVLTGSHSETPNKAKNKKKKRKRMGHMTIQGEVRDTQKTSGFSKRTNKTKWILIQYPLVTMMGEKVHIWSQPKEKKGWSNAYTAFKANTHMVGKYSGGGGGGSKKAVVSAFRGNRKETHTPRRDKMV